MSRVRLLANMSISPQAVKVLQGEGWDVVRVSDLVPVNTSDADVLELARSENRVVLTQDLDFQPS